MVQAPDYFIAYQQCGRIYMMHGRSNPQQREKYFDKAIFRLNQAIEINKDDYFSFYLLARIYEVKKDKETMRKYLHKICQIEPPVENEYGYVGRASRSLKEINGEKNRLNKQNEAISHFTKALEYNPTLACAMNSRGEIYLDQNKYQQAEQDFNRVIELIPYYELAYLNRGNLYWKIKQYRKAKFNYEKYVEYITNEFQPYFQLARLYSIERNKQKALENLEQAFEKGFANFQQLGNDESLSYIAKSKEFLNLVLKYGAKKS